MKTILLVTLLTALPLSLNSQSPQPGKSPLAVLSELKAANKTLIEKQQATLKVLEQMQHDVAQLKTFSKRGI